MEPNSLPFSSTHSAGFTICAVSVVCRETLLCSDRRFRRCRRTCGITTVNSETTKTSLQRHIHQRLQERFDEIFGQRYPHHYGLNLRSVGGGSFPRRTSLAMQQFCAHKEELLRVLDTPQVPLHTNAAEADIREYVTLAQD